MPSKLKKNNNIKAALVISLLFLFLVGFGFYLHRTSYLTDTVKTQLAAIQAGDMIKAYGLTSHDFQKASSFAVFKSYVDHYPPLKHNASVSFSESHIKGDDGILLGTLTSEEGETVTVEYRLSKEEGQWKIAYIDLGDVARGSASTETGLEKLYDNKEFHYSMRYPANWEYENIPHDKAMFSGVKGSASYDSLVSIQVINPNDMGKAISNLNDFKNLLVRQMLELSPDFKLIKEGDVELATDPKKYYGQYFIATYTFEGAPFKKMQFVLERNDGRMFYTWSYTSSMAQFDTDLPRVKAMFESWDIN